MHLEGRYLITRDRCDDAISANRADLDIQEERTYSKRTSYVPNLHSEYLDGVNKTLLKMFRPRSCHRSADKMTSKPKEDQPRVP